jgi:hypothetical protein
VLQGSTIAANGENSIFLYANGQGTQTPATYYISPTGSDTTGDGSASKPWQSMLQASIVGAAGSIVYMQPGSYKMSERVVGFRDDGGKWQTFESAPGIARDQVTVVIDSTSSMRPGHLAFKNIRLDMTSGITSARMAGVWLDGVDVFSSLANNSLVGLLSADQMSAGEIYVTSTDMHDINGYAMKGVMLARNVTVENTIVGHPSSSPGLLVNAHFDNIRSTDDKSVLGTISEPHVDGIDWNATGDANSIVYNTSITNLQNGFLFMSFTGLQNLALVNFTGGPTLGTGPGGQNQFDRQSADNYKHVLLDNVQLANQALVFDDRGGGASQWSDVLVQNSSATWIGAPSPIRLIGDTLPDGTPIVDQ